MFGIKQLRARLALLELDVATNTQVPVEPTIEIPVVDAKGKPVMARKVLFCYPYVEEKVHTMSLQAAFDKLQEAMGVQIVLQQAADAKVKVNKVKRSK